jgi:hypothetical protein
VPVSVRHRFADELLPAPGTVRGDVALHVVTHDRPPDELVDIMLNVNVAASASQTDYVD